MPVADGQAYVEAARRQVDALVGPSIEILVIDDASTDATPMLLARWAADDSRVRILTQPSRRGVAAGRNRAVSEARGRWVWFVDCDDEWSPHILERLVEVATARDSDVVCCQADSKHEDGSPGHELPHPLGAREIDGQAALLLLLRSEIRGHLWNKLFDRALFDLVSFPATWAHSDLGAMGDLLVSARRVALVDDVLYTYILRPSSIIGSGSGRSRDLLTVLGRITAATSGLRDRSEVEAELRSFAYREVYLPTLHRQMRNEHLDAQDVAVRTEIRRRVSLGSASSVARHGHAVTALATLSASYASPVHARVYRAVRRRRWLATDGAAP
jgi:glycosyltransferase involved in cell wall biosynthesis